MGKKVSNGVVHKAPVDLVKSLTASLKALAVFEDITPLARNEWICWVTSAKKAETRNRRIRIMCENLSAGKRRPCCFAGCPHR